MFGRLTEKDRNTLETLRRSPQWSQLTQQVFAERVQRRQRIADESARRQVELRKAYEAHGAKIIAAEERLKRAEADLIAARDARQSVQSTADGARHQLEREECRVRRALRDDSEPMVGRIENLCIGLEDHLRLKVWVKIGYEKNVLGGVMHRGFTNTDEVRKAMEAVRRVGAEMRELAESPYPQNLAELLAARHELLRKIDQRFECKYIAERELELEAA